MSQVLTAQNLRLLVDLSRREFKVRYLGSLLGSYWNLIHPLVMIFIYTVVFSQVMKARLGEEAGKFSYSIYLCSGLLAWNFFSEIVNRGTVTLLDNASFMKKLSFPPIILFGATLVSAAINFVIAFAIFFVALMIIYPASFDLFAVYFVVVLLFATFATGLGVGLGCLNVFMRDFQQLTGLIFQLWFWFTPIIYLTSALPEIARQMLYFNPAFAFIEPLHQILYFHKFPEPKFWGLMIIWNFLGILFAVFVYRRTISAVRDHL